MSIFACGIKNKDCSCEICSFHLGDYREKYQLNTPVIIQHTFILLIRAVKLLKVCIKFDLFIKSLLEPRHKSNLKVTNEAAQLCLRKTCLAHLDDIKGCVFIKNMDILTLMNM